MKMPYRCRWDKKVAGVCGGLGHYFKIDPTFIRLGFILLLYPTFFIPPILIYLILWMLLPQGPSVYIETRTKKLYRSTYNRRLAGICGGIGEFLKIDGNIIRIIFVVMTLITGFFPLITAYIVGSLIIPERPR